MDIRESAIWEEIEDIIEDGPKGAHFRYSCEIDADGETLEPFQLVMVDAERNYHEKLADDIFMTIKIKRKDYEDLIYPNREDLKVTLYKVPIKEGSGEENFDDGVDSRMYRAILLKPESTVIESENPSSGSRAAMDFEPPEEYEFQLIDLAVDQLRVKAIGGIYTDTKTSDAIKGIITVACNGLDLSDDADMKGVDVVDGDNTDPREHIIIPHGTPLKTLPKYIQQEAGGVYYSGISSYIQNGVYYVYPEYNVKRFSEVEDTLTVFNIPERSLPGIERTYLEDNGRVRIISTGEVKHNDFSEKFQGSGGNGVRFVDANRILEGFHTVEENIATVSRVDNINEFLIHDRDSGDKNAPMSERYITANGYREISEVTKRLGSLVHLVWENANPDLLYPGQPSKFVYMDGEDLTEMYGTLMGVNYTAVIQGSTTQSKNHYVMAQLTIYLEGKE